MSFHETELFVPRLNNLAIVSIENNVVATLYLEAAIENFEDMRTRKKCFFINSVFYK